MKKMKKIRNSYLKIGILIFLVLILGFMLGFFSNKMNMFSIKKNLIQINALIMGKIIWIQLALFFGLLIETTKNLVKVKKLYLKYGEDEDEIYDFIERVQERSLTITQITFILNLIMFAFALTEKNDLIRSSIIIFIITAIYIGIIEIYLINQAKKYDMSKKGNPVDLVFEKHWMNSCDEAEKMIVYKVSYETLKVMKHTFLFVIVLLFIFKIKFNAGNFSIALVGIIWCIMVLSSFYYSKKIKKIGGKYE